MSKEMQYDFAETLADLDAGVFQQKLSKAVKDAAISVAAHGDGKRKGKVVIELTMERIGETMQVKLDHKIAGTYLRKRGKATEEDTTSTSLYVHGDGRLSIMPPSGREQSDWMADLQEGRE
jgi:hypothetical protein